MKMISIEEKKIWRLLLHAIHDLRTSLHSVGGFAYLIKEDGRQPSLSEKERLDVLRRLEQSYEQLQKEVNRLTDIAYYSTVDQLPRTDKVLVNELCRDIAGGREVEVLYGSDIPDYYAISTNRAALERVLEILLHHACERTASCKDDGRELYVFLNVTERGEKGSLTFSVSDMGELPTLEENLKYFNPPTAADNRKVSTSTEIYYYQLLVRLLGGFIYIDPDYKNGRRVIFSIAI